jgi:hypothetical protein
MKRISEDAKTIQLALAVGFMEIVRYDEEQINYKSARSSALRNLIDNTWKVTDQFKINAWPPAKLKFADELLTAVETLVHNRTGAYYEWRSGWQ